MVYDTGMRETAGEMAERPNAGGLSTDLGAQAPRGFESHSLRPHRPEGRVLIGFAYRGREDRPTHIVVEADLHRPGKKRTLCSGPRRWDLGASPYEGPIEDVECQRCLQLEAQTRTEAPQGTPVQTDYQPETL